MSPIVSKLPGKAQYNRASHRGSTTSFLIFSHLRIRETGCRAASRRCGSFSPDQAADRSLETSPADLQYKWKITAW